MKFAAHCFTSGIVLNSTPTAECIAGHIQTACSAQQKRSACVHVRVCTCVFTQECMSFFSSFTRHLWLFSSSLRHFPRLFVLWKTLIRVVFPPALRDAAVRSSASRPCGSHRRVDLAVWYNCCFSSEETLRSRKPCPCTSCKNISTCLKNLRETTWPLGLGWRPLVWREGRPHTTFPWSLRGIYPGTPFWRNPT